MSKTHGGKRIGSGAKKKESSVTANKITISVGSETNAILTEISDEGTSKSQAIEEAVQKAHKKKRFVTHVTLQTGEKFISRESYVSPKEIEIFRKVIEKSLDGWQVEVPTKKGYFLKLETAPANSLSGSVSCEGQDLVSFCIHIRSRKQYTWKKMHFDSVIAPKTGVSKSPPTPFMAVSLLPGLDRRDHSWIKDFSIKIVWAWREILDEI